MYQVKFKKMKYLLISDVLPSTFFRHRFHFLINATAYILSRFSYVNFLSHIRHFFFRQTTLKMSQLEYPSPARDETVVEDYHGTKVGWDDYHGTKVGWDDYHWIKVYIYMMIYFHWTWVHIWWNITYMIKYFHWT